MDNGMHNSDILLLLIPEFELDDDELDDSALSQLRENSLQSARTRRRNGEQNMPLLVGLVDHSAARQSLDIPLTTNDVGSAEDGYNNLEELAAKRTSGGNMFDSIANMANSILGAGEANWTTPVPYH